MLGNINIYFGTVVSVEDDQHLLRIKVRINGITDLLSDEELPWYFPWYGINYLPEVYDIVPVIIFDNVVTSGFYNRRIDFAPKIPAPSSAPTDPSAPILSQEDYNNYLEIFKRTIGTDDVELSYTPSTGIDFMNADSMINIAKDKLTLFVSANFIEMTEDTIKIGQNATQYALLGDEVVELLGEMCEIMMEITKAFQTVSTTNPGFIAACLTPFTAAFNAPITLLATQMTTISTSIATLSGKIIKPVLQSSKTMIE
jgi:hypothetical protein